MKKYYLYRHIRLDMYIPFYIGIGSQKDTIFTYKRANSIYERNRYWKSIVNKTTYKVEILYETFDVEEIKKKEIEFINLYGRANLDKGSLCNLTDGGDGVRNVKWSDEYKAKSSKRMLLNPTFKGRHHTLENKLKLSLLRKGIDNRKTPFKHTKESKEKLSLSHKNGNKERYIKAGFKHRKPVLQYDLNMNFIKEWDYLVQIQEHLNYDRSSIGKCCNQKQKHAYNFIWRFKNTI